MLKLKLTCSELFEVPSPCSLVALAWQISANAFASESQRSLSQTANLSGACRARPPLLSPLPIAVICANLVVSLGFSAPRTSASEVELAPASLHVSYQDRQSNLHDIPIVLRAATHCCHWRLGKRDDEGRGDRRAKQSDTGRSPWLSGGGCDSKYLFATQTRRRSAARTDKQFSPEDSR